MHTTTLRKVGGSVMLALPRALLDVLHLTVGAKVGLTVDNGRLVVEPQVRPRHTLDELLAQCDGSAKTTAEDWEWLESKPFGGELLGWNRRHLSISCRSIRLPAMSTRGRARC